MTKETISLTEAAEYLNTSPATLEECNVAARLAQISGIFCIAPPPRITPSKPADHAARTPP